MLLEVPSSVLGRFCHEYFCHSSLFGICCFGFRISNMRARCAHPTRENFTPAFSLSVQHFLFTSREFTAKRFLAAVARLRAGGWTAHGDSTHALRERSYDLRERSYDLRERSYRCSSGHSNRSRIGGRGDSHATSWPDNGCGNCRAVACNPRRRAGLLRAPYFLSPTMGHAASARCTRI